MLLGLSVTLPECWRAANVQVEEQNQPVALPKTAPQADSGESKPKRGGKRPGAGRKPNIAKRLLSGVKPMTAAEALEGIDVQAIVHDLLKNGSRPVKLQTLTVLWDRVFGKPKQDVSVSGGLLHTQGISFFEEICARDLEGIVCKRKRSIYKSNGTGWIKVKNPKYSQAEGRHDLFNPRER